MQDAAANLSRLRAAAPQPEDERVGYTGVVPLATGSLGDVVLAVRTGGHGLRRVCALRRLRRTLAIDPSFRALYVREAERARRMAHPHVVATFDVCEQDGAPCVAMEYLDGQTLRLVASAMAQASYSADPLLWVSVASDVLDGLHHAHELTAADGSWFGMVHGDVSPHHVFITYEGRVVVLDFASSRLKAEAQRIDSGVVAGKRGYLAPERLAGAPYDRRADVYAVGVILWELLAERRAPQDGGPPPALDTLRRDIDPRLAAIVARAVAPEPPRRFPTAGAMRDALETYADAAGRMRRRDALASVVSMLFDEERTRLDDEMRTRLARVEARDEDPPPSSRYESSVRPVALLDRVNRNAGRSAEPYMLSGCDIVSMTELANDNEDDLLAAAVSVPAGDETRPMPMELACASAESTRDDLMVALDVPQNALSVADVLARVSRLEVPIAVMPLTREDGASAAELRRR